MQVGTIEQTPDYYMFTEVHTTDYFEIIIFSEGQGNIEIDTNTVAITRGLFLFISPYQKRRWHTDRSSITGYYLSFEKDFLNDFFADHFFVYRLQYFFHPKVSPYFITETRLFSFENDIFSEIEHEFCHFQKDSPHLLRAILYYILIKLNRIYCNYHELPYETDINNHAYQFKAYLEKHIHQKQRVADYAALMQISRVSLNTAVKKQFGQTAKDMIKERLIIEIKTTLRYTRKTVTEIAYDLHFSEVNNMIRFFKAHTGQSPNQYRLKQQS